MRRLPPLNALRTFEAAARHEHFGRAATELCVTDSAVSHQIRLLEEQIGVQLFVREGRKVRLTVAARELLATVQHALDMIADSCTSVGMPGTHLQLRVSAPAELAHRWLALRLGQFAANHPDIAVHLTVHASDCRDVQTDADISVLYGLGLGDWKQYWVKAFPPLDFFPVCSPSLMKNGSAAEGHAFLASHLLLHDDADKHTWATWLSAHMGDLGMPARHLHFAHAGLALEVAASGVGVALADRFTAQHDLETGRLIRPFKGSIPAFGNYYFVVSRRKRNQSKIVTLINWLMADSTAIKS